MNGSLPSIFIRIIWIDQSQCVSKFEQKIEQKLSKKLTVIVEKYEKVAVILGVGCYTSGCYTERGVYNAFWQFFLNLCSFFKLYFGYTLFYVVNIILFGLACEIIFDS